MVEVMNPFGDDEVVGVVTPSRSATVVEAGMSAGFEVSVIADASEITIGGDGEDDGLFDRFVRAFQEGEEKDALRRFAGRLEEGDRVVRLKDVGDRAEEAGKLMADNGAEIVWHFGTWTYTPLHQT